MVFNCSFCETETVYVAKFCVGCRIIKNIGNVYGFEDIKNILESVCIRNSDQKERKIKQEIKKNTPVTKLDDDTYIKGGLPVGFSKKP